MSKFNALPQRTVEAMRWLALQASPTAGLTPTNASRILATPRDEEAKDKLSQMTAARRDFLNG